MVSSLKSEAAVAAAREDGVRRDLDALKARSAVSSRDEITLRELDREATANRTLLETFLGRYAEVSSRGDLSDSGYRKRGSFRAPACRSIRAFRKNAAFGIGRDDRAVLRDCWRC